MAKRHTPRQTTNSLRALAPSREKDTGSREGAKALSGEMTEQLPEGWGDITLADICNINPRKPSVGEVAPGAEVTFVPMPAVDAEARAITNAVVRSFEQVRKGFTSFRDEDVILAKITPCFENGKAAICRGLRNGLGFDSTEFHVLRSNGAVLPEYVYRFVQQDLFLRDGQANMTGSVGQKRVPAAWLASLRIPLPPLAEQRRIVARVDALLARVQAARARLAKVPALLKRFRQSVLAAACSGELTAEWREEHTPNESVGDLLHRLAVEREKRWSSVVKTRYNVPVEPDADASLICPDEWAVASMDQLTILITSGSRDWSKYYGRGTGTFIMAQNVRPGYLDLSFRQDVDPPNEHRDCARSQVAVGDLLVTIVGANTGDACPVTTELPEHYVCQSVSLMRPTDYRLCPYLNLYLNSSAHGRGQYDRYIYGEGRPHLSFDHLRMTAVLLPPIQEQHEIVRRVEALFAFADKIESRVGFATERVEKTTQAILAKAFRGELVTTEAELARQENRDYEPASTLVERIRAERAAAHNEPGRNSGRRKSPSTRVRKTKP